MGDLRALRTGLAIAALSVGLVASGCSSENSPSRSADQATLAQSAAEGVSAQPEMPKVKRTRPADPLAPRTIPPVKRPGTTTKQRLEPSRRAADLGKATPTVTYPDGISLQIGDIEQGRITGQGPGEIRSATTAFPLLLTNGSNRALDLDSVVVTAVYGEPRRIARPVYGDDEKDLFGDVKPDEATKGLYTFAIPAADLEQVTIHVDFDNTHTAAVFRGDAR